MRKHQVLMAVLMVSLAFACAKESGAKDGGGGDGGVDAGKEGLLRKATDAVMDRLAECGPFQIQQLGGDLAAIKDREFKTMLPLLELPGITLDYISKEFIDTITSLSCGEFSRLASLQSQPKAEYGFDASRGLANGQPCMHPLQCASLVCLRLQGASCGVCAAPIAIGGKCDDVNIVLGSPCGMGNTCAGGVCKPFGDKGAQCNATTAPCFIDLGCVGGVCGAFLGKGDTCTSLTGECDIKEVLACEPNIKKCVLLKWVEDGKACGIKDNGLFVCKKSDCFPSVLDGTCRAPAEDGKPCDSAAGPGCLLHAQCVNGICEQYFTPVCK
jgi:hypothetical protein